MNSDKFDRIVLDLLYEELDELTTAAAKRHMEQSARAREIFAHLKATRKLGILPVHEPPVNFELAVMEGVRRTLSELPVHHRIGRIVSMLAGYAMRPQLIMGALLMLMIGSSLILVRVRPGQHSAVQVTERGAPEAEVDVILPLAAAPAVSAPLVDGLTPPAPERQHAGAFVAPEPRDGAHSTTSSSKPVSTITARGTDAGRADDGVEPFDQAVLAYRAGRYTEAQRGFERLSRLGGPRAAEAALYAAQATRNVSGCAPAVSRFERVRIRFPGSGPAYEAAWRAARCLQQLGDIEGARQSYESLLQVTSHAQRAREALGALGASAPAAARGGLGIPQAGTPPLALAPTEPPQADQLAAALDATELAHDSAGTDSAAGAAPEAPVDPAAPGSAPKSAETSPAGASDAGANAAP